MVESPAPAAAEAEMCLGQLVEQWAPELRRTRVRGRSNILADWLIRFKMWWDPLSELEPYLRLRERNAPGGIVVVLVSDYDEIVRRHAERSKLRYHQVLFGSAHTQMLVGAADITRFCRRSGLPPPSFWPETVAQPTSAPKTTEPIPSPNSREAQVRRIVARRAAVKRLIDDGRIPGSKGYTYDLFGRDVRTLCDIDHKARGFDRTTLRKDIKALKTPPK